MVWTLAAAKDQLSEVVRRAVDQGPQIISIRGKDTAVVLSKAEYDALLPAERSFKEHLLAFPKVDDLDLTRDQTPSRDFEF
jgi:prevent-host-death family protein